MLSTRANPLPTFLRRFSPLRRFFRATLSRRGPRKEMTMRNTRMLRRSFLAGAGTTALGTLLRPIMAHAQMGAAPQRLLLIHRPCGTALGVGHDNWWWPSGGTTGWTASPLLSSFTDGKIASLPNNMEVLQHLQPPRTLNWTGAKHVACLL